MNDQADVKDNEHMMIVPKYFKVRSPTEKVLIRNQLLCQNSTKSNSQIDI